MPVTDPRSAAPRRVAVAALLVAGLAGLGYVTWRPGDTPLAAGGAPTPPRQPAGAAAGDSGRAASTLARQVGRLTEALAAEGAARQRLEERLASIEAQLTDLYSAATDTAASRPSALPEALSAAADSPPADAAGTAMERALIAAGIDVATATDIKRRRDELTMAEITLSDQATREQWLETPRFAQAMATLAAQRTSIRDEIGDDSYDRYLAARGEPNRVRVDEVLAETAAAAAGLQAGDVVLRYGAARIFAPDDLVTETRGGTAGEVVRVEVLRQGQRFEVTVPRGPLGLRIAASQGSPGEG